MLQEQSSSAQPSAHGRLHQHDRRIGLSAWGEACPPLECCKLRLERCDDAAPPD